MAKPKLAVYKFSSCDGCQLSLLDCEDELLAIAEVIDIANFPEASRAVSPGPYDLTLVEGSVSTPHDAQRILEVRKESRVLVTIGACATAGGIQALKNFADKDEYIRTVYAHPHYIKTLDHSHPIAQYVPVDFELRGCPISKTQLLEVVNAFLNHRKPQISNHSVCTECKARNNACVMVADAQPCLGPVTHSGCQALCPSYGRACFGCYGPKEAINTSSLASQWLKMGASSADIRDAFRHINAWSAPFKKEGDAHE